MTKYYFINIILYHFFSNEDPYHYFLKNLNNMITDMSVKKECILY